MFGVLIYKKGRIEPRLFIYLERSKKKKIAAIFLVSYLI